MNIKQHLILLILITAFYQASGQKEAKTIFYYGDPVLLDSTSTIMIPKRYTNQSGVPSNKWGESDYFANVIFYNYTNDVSKKLFSEDTYIVRNNPLFYKSNAWGDQRGINCLLYLVKKTDQNKNGRIDDSDPSILFVSDINGDNLKQLTTEKESVVSYDIFAKKNFALIKIKPDSNMDGYFSAEDKEYYLIKLDLSTLTFGHKIELK